jgi:hypothetical protein
MSLAGAANDNDDVTFLSHISSGGLDLVQLQLPHDKEPDQE